MEYVATGEGLSALGSYWADAGYHLNWTSVFVLPSWLEVWWRVFGSGAELFLRAVRQGQDIIGIAPLRLRDKTAAFIGSADVCDYLDFIVASGREDDFFNGLLDDLPQKGINQLDLNPVRPDSSVLRHLVPMAQARGHEVSCTATDVSLEMELPPTWEEYLAGLTTKQRHEVRRKLRRLGEMGRVDYRFVDSTAGDGEVMDNFLQLFTGSRVDKATFLTAQMESFFRSLADTMSRAGLMRFGVLELDAVATAIIMCFDYHDCVYLYNSGFDRRYDYLSVGLLSKVMAIQDSIKRGKKRFDFLKGAEPYKYHLGGREVPLYRCRITIK